MSLQLGQLCLLTGIYQSQASTVPLRLGEMGPNLPDDEISTEQFLGLWVEEDIYTPQRDRGRIYYSICFLIQSYIA